MSQASIADRLDAVLRGEDVSWRTLDADAPGDVLDLCAQREISPLVQARLLARAEPADWPEEVRHALARAAQEAAAIELVRGREITAVLDALAADDVLPILLKGVPLAYTLYDSPGSRPHADTDLFVPRSQIETVRRTLRGLGYDEPPLSEGELVFCQFPMMKRDRLGVDHAFDFHWKISTQTMFADLFTYDELAAAVVPVPALGRHAFAAGPAHALLLACVHPVMHHRDVDRSIWVYDIHLLASQLTDTALDAFGALAIEKRVAAICARQLARARERFHTRVSNRVMAALSSASAADEPSAVYLEPARRWHDELASNVRGLPRWADRLRLLREVLLPGPRYMAQRYRLSAPGLVLLPVMYAHRCVYGAWKIVAGRK